MNYIYTRRVFCKTLTFSGSTPSDHCLFMVHAENAKSSLLQSNVGQMGIVRTHCFPKQLLIKIILTVSLISRVIEPINQLDVQSVVLQYVVGCTMLGGSKHFAHFRRLHYLPMFLQRKKTNFDLEGFKQHNNYTNILAYILKHEIVYEWRKFQYEKFTSYRHLRSRYLRSILCLMKSIVKKVPWAKRNILLKNNYTQIHQNDE